jgi:hypothetical protein
MARIRAFQLSLELILSGQTINALANYPCLILRIAQKTNNPTYPATKVSKNTGRTSKCANLIS